MCDRDILTFPNDHTMDSHFPIADTIGITAFRNDISHYFQETVSGKKFIITKSWNKAVLICQRDYNDLLELLEFLLGDTPLSKALLEKRQCHTQELMKRLHLTDEM